MAAVCKVSDSIDFCPGTINLLCLKEGFSYPDEWAFTDELGAVIDISADDFEFVITDALGIVVDTLTLGTIATTGLEFITPNKLKFLIGAPTTTTAGTYTYELIITEPGGGRYPWFAGRIVVKAA